MSQIPNTQSAAQVLLRTLDEYGAGQIAIVGTDHDDQPLFGVFATNEAPLALALRAACEANDDVPKEDTSIGSIYRAALVRGVHVYDLDGAGEEWIVARTAHEALTYWNGLVDDGLGSATRVAEVPDEELGALPYGTDGLTMDDAVLLHLIRGEQVPAVLASRNI